MVRITPSGVTAMPALRGVIPAQKLRPEFRMLVEKNLRRIDRPRYQRIDGDNLAFPFWIGAGLPGEVLGHLIGDLVAVIGDPVSLSPQGESVILGMRKYRRDA